MGEDTRLSADELEERGVAAGSRRRGRAQPGGHERRTTARFARHGIEARRLHLVQAVAKIKFHIASDAQNR